MSDHAKSASSDRKPNRLINEQSPYLRQHAYNPVDWYPWGEEALARARREDKPILLSIGYSACHWCHVMERESFENEAISRLMNERFIPIKVDREERPDLDQIYMDAVQLLTGRGGWPLTMFLTPDGKPFYGGTYFPPVDRHGLPAFPRVLAAIAQAWSDKRDDVNENVGRIAAAMNALGGEDRASGEPAADLPLRGAHELARHYDSAHGGIGGAPKFPNTFIFSLFLRMYDADGDPSFADMTRDTLARMAKGGIYDQLGGGFHRYSVDERWLTPHFEKMLYDNALLTRLYLDAGRALNEPDLIHVAREILDYVMREMTSPEGGFHSSQDADSEGEEGKFFVWTPDEFRTVLGGELAALAQRWFDVSDEGNFEGRNILHRTISIADAARLFGKSEDATAAAIAEIRSRLFAAREARVRPGRDDKILAAWNGMMIGAFAEGYRATGEARYLQAALKATDFVMKRMWDGRRLKRSYKDGVARFNAYLEDYALMAGALIDVYEATLDRRNIESARALADTIVEHFSDREQGGFFFTSDDHEELIARTRPAFDGSTPSGNSAAVMALLRLDSYLDGSRYAEAAARALRSFANGMEKQPFAFAHMLEALDRYHRGATEIVLAGDPTCAEFAEWRDRLGLLYAPNLALYAADTNPNSESFLPEAARGKRAIDGRITAYVCRNRSCSAPITSFEEFVRAIAG